MRWVDVGILWLSYYCICDNRRYHTTHHEHVMMSWFSFTCLIIYDVYVITYFVLWLLVVAGLHVLDINSTWSHRFECVLSKWPVDRRWHKFPSSHSRFKLSPLSVVSWLELSCSVMWYVVGPLSGCLVEYDYLLD